MIDATGMPQTSVLLGGTSDIGLEILERLAGARLERAVLAGRDAAGLEAAAARIESAGCAEVSWATCDLSSATSIDDLLALTADRLSGIDNLIVSVGDLGTADLDALDPQKVMQMFSANAGGPAAAMLGFAKLMSAQGHGQIVVLSSVAGLRVRRANFVYGAGKAALDGFALGLADSVRERGVAVMVVRPGFVRTKMTARMADAPLTCDPADVADAVVAGLGRRAEVVYVPAAMQAAFVGLRLLPRSVFRRLPG